MTNHRKRQDNRTILRKLVCRGADVRLRLGARAALPQDLRGDGINVVTTRDADAERAARNTQVDTSRKVIVEFDANSQGLRFRPHGTTRGHPRLGTWTTTGEPRAAPMVGQAIPATRRCSRRRTSEVECFCSSSRLWPQRDARFRSCSRRSGAAEG